MSEIIITPAPETVIDLSATAEIDVTVTPAAATEIDVTANYQPASEELSLLASVNSSSLGRQLLAAVDPVAARELLEIELQGDSPIAMTDVEGLIESLTEKANATHTHEATEIEGLQPSLDGLSATVNQTAASVTALANAVAGKANFSHTHAISEIEELAPILNAKANNTHSHSFDDIIELASDQPLTAIINNLGAEIDSKAPLEHTHSISAIANLQNELNGKAELSHTHPISAIANLANELNNKAALNHSHLFGQYEVIHGWFNISQAVSSTLVDLPAIDTTVSNLRLVQTTYDITNKQFITPAGGLYLVGVAGRVSDFTNVTSLRLSIFINNNESFRAFNTYAAWRITTIGANVPVRFQCSCDQSRTFNGGAFLWRIA